MIGLGWGSPLHRELRRALIRESELEYLLGRHNRHHEVRRHVRIAKPLVIHIRTRPVAFLALLALIAGVLWLLA